MYEETENYRGFDIQIEHDTTPANPWIDWDGEPPLIAIADHDWDQCYGIDQSVPELTKDQIRANIHGLQALTGTRSLLNLIEEYAPHYKRNYRDAAEAINEALYCYADGLRKSDRLEFIAAVYRMAGIAALCTSRQGYSQGDYIELLIVATPEWVELTGAPAETHERQLQAAADLYAWWAFGDVYGYTVETEDGEHVGSVWGYYGPDHDKSGLLENARNDIDCYIDQQRKAKTETVKKWIRGHVPLIYRHFDPVLNV